MTVDGSHVLEAEVREHAVRPDEPLQRALAVHDGLVGEGAHLAAVLEGALSPPEKLLVAGVRADHVEPPRETACSRRVRAAVVVDDDDNAVVRRRERVERLPRHAAGEGAVADHGNRVAIRLAAQRAAASDSCRPRQRGRRVGVLDDVVLALRARGVTGEAAPRSERGEVAAAREQLVDVCLVAGVEDDGVVRRLEDPVQRNGELHDAKVWAEVPARARDRVDEVVADLAGKFVALRQA